MIVLGAKIMSALIRSSERLDADVSAGVKLQVIPLVDKVAFGSKTEMLRAVIVVSLACNLVLLLQISSTWDEAILRRGGRGFAGGERWDQDSATSLIWR